MLNSRINYALVTLFGACALSAHASDNLSGVARDVRLDSRDLRSTARSVRNFFSEPFVLGAEPAPAPVPQMYVEVGVSQDEDETDVKTISTPFTFSYSTAHSKDSNDFWQFQLVGDGITHVDTPGMAAADGVGDFTFDVLRPLSDTLTVLAGLSVPSGDAVGSAAATQQLQLVYDKQFTKSPWEVLAIAGLTHVNGVASGQNPYRDLAHAEIIYNFADNQALLAKVTRSHESGVGSSTEVGAEYDVPIKKMLLETSWVRGLSAGSRHTGVEVDLRVTF